jgi:Homeodomain-like domain
VGERERARDLRAQAWTISEIAAELGVCRSSVSVWVRDVDFEEAPRAARARVSTWTVQVVLVRPYRDSVDPVRHALPGGARPEHPSLETSAGLPRGELRVVRYPP